MRINVYSQELDLNRVPELVTKNGLNSEGHEEVFTGIRFFLVSPDVIHQSKEDDDQSAITFWLPRSRDKRSALAARLHYMSKLIMGRTVDLPTT